MPTPESRSTSIRVLATDLDGTLFPTDPTVHGPSIAQIVDLVREHHLRLVYVTGRSFPQVLEGIKQYRCPVPEAIICDVGSTTMHRSGDRFVRSEEYHATLRSRMQPWTHGRLVQAVLGLGLPLTRQPDPQQTELKCSFDFPAARRDEVTVSVQNWITADEVPVSMTISVDPFTGTGMMDLLPRGADKGSALAHWIDAARLSPAQVIYAGDTGNDSAAINSGVCGILVGNADDQLRTEARNHHGADASRLFEATEDSTSGLLQGIRHFLGCNLETRRVE